MCGNRRRQSSNDSLTSLPPISVLPVFFAPKIGSELCGHTDARRVIWSDKQINPLEGALLECPAEGHCGGFGTNPLAGSNASNPVAHSTVVVTCKPAADLNATHNLAFVYISDYPSVSGILLPQIVAFCDPSSSVYQGIGRGTPIEPWTDRPYRPKDRILQLTGVSRLEGTYRNLRRKLPKSRLSCMLFYRSAHHRLSG